MPSGLFEKSKDIIKSVQSDSNLIRVRQDLDRFVLYQGKLREVIQGAIRKEFQKPETVEELSARVIPINIIQKIINKLAGVYLLPPDRVPIDDNPGDNELIQMFEKTFKINQKMKQANRFFKLHKHVALEPYIDHMGVPRMRVLPSQTYTPIGEDPVDPQRVTTFVKHLITDGDKADQRFTIWTDEEFLIVDGEGVPVFAEMEAMNNPEGINPYGRIPFTYISESDDGSLIPISDDDLVTMQVAICLLLSDLAFASKYQAWSVVAISGAESEGNLSFNPSSIITLPEGAKIDVIKPEIDSDKMLRMVESMLGMLLTTKNLSVAEVSMNLSAENAASGIAKMMDRAESTEDRLDQQAYFESAEKDFWELFSHHMLPYWISQNLVDPKYTGVFSEPFELSISFSEPKPIQSEKETLELQLEKLENKLTTRFQALKELNPEFEDNQVELLIDEIDKEEVENVRMLDRNLNTTTLIEEEN